MHNLDSTIMQKIKSIVTDVDGVFTDGGFYYSESGKILKKFGPHDGDGIKYLRKIGIHIEAISADHRGFAITHSRMKDMGLNLTLVSESDRRDWILNKFDPETTMFIGDGLHDIPALEACLIGIAPANALECTKHSADYVTSTEGGNGVLFEVAELFATFTGDKING